MSIAARRLMRVSRTSPTTPPGDRIAKFHPFASDSVWNLPIVQGTDTYDMPTIRNSGSIYANYHQYSHGVFFAKASDPVVTYYDNWGGQVDWWLPADAVPQTGRDGHLEIASPDGKEILETITARIASDRSHVNTRNAIVVDLYDKGIGPRNGVRAYGGSAVGGLIREYDVQQGVIDHAIAIAVDMSYQLGKTPTNTWDWGGDNYYYWDSSVTNQKQPGWNAGQPRYGFGRRHGYVWPATEQDGFSDESNRYNGDIPMGAYFCIPSTVNVDSLGLNGPALMVGKALQKYGAYVTDATEGTAFYVEKRGGGSGQMSDFASQLSSHARRLVEQLRRVANNDQNNPNGGPLNHPDRPPQIPGLA